MRLVIAAIGRLKVGPERDLAGRYRERAAGAGRAVGVRSVEVLEFDESRARRTQDRLEEEAAAIGRGLPEIAAIVALDSRGEALSSKEFAARLEGWRDQAIPATVFVIGGADGLAESVRRRARLCLAFGPATWPHQLVRIMLLEQIYRAVTILSGHPYHRE